MMCETGGCFGEGVDAGTVFGTDACGGCVARIDAFADASGNGDERFGLFGNKIGATDCSGAPVEFTRGCELVPSLASVLSCSAMITSIALRRFEALACGPFRIGGFD